MALVKISNKQKVNTALIEKENTGFVKFITGKRVSTVEPILPFRVRFTAIQVPGYSPTTVPPIPLQIIGFSNYIL